MLTVSNHSTTLQKSLLAGDDAATFKHKLRKQSELTREDIAVLGITALFSGGLTLLLFAAMHLVESLHNAYLKRNDPDSTDEAKQEKISQIFEQLSDEILYGHDVRTNNNPTKENPFTTTITDLQGRTRQFILREIEEYGEVYLECGFMQPGHTYGHHENEITGEVFKKKMGYAEFHDAVCKNILPRSRTKFLTIAKNNRLLTDKSTSTQLIQQLTKEEYSLQSQSMKLFSNLDEKNQGIVAFQRDLWSISGNCSSNQTNQELLGCTESAIRSAGANSLFVQPDNQLSILLRTSYRDDAVNGTTPSITHPHILSVAAPALDFIELNEATVHRRPEILTYITTSPETQITELNQENYATAFNTLAEHIIAAAKDTQCERVVLCAYGTGAFMIGLDHIGNKSQDQPTEKVKATAIIVNSFSRMIIALRSQNIEVAYTDFKGKSREFWNAVNQNINPNLGDDYVPLTCLGAIGTGWVKDTDLLVNAWDPDSTLGNGGNIDQTADGQYGRRSTMQFIHADTCYHANKINNLSEKRPELSFID